jgi:hypothetical protein
VFHIGTSCHLHPQTSIRALSVFLSMYVDEEAYYKRYLKLLCPNISPLAIRAFSIPFLCTRPNPSLSLPGEQLSTNFPKGPFQKTSHWVNVELLNQAVQLPGDPLSLSRPRADSQPFQRLRMRIFFKIGETYISLLLRALVRELEGIPPGRNGSW